MNVLGWIVARPGEHGVVIDYDMREDGSWSGKYLINWDKSGIISCAYDEFTPLGCGKS